MTQSHGGKRPGAGRKPNPDGPKLSKSCSVDKDVAEYLSEVGTGIVNGLVKRSKAFREWRKR